MNVSALSTTNKPKHSFWELASDLIARAIAFPNLICYRSKDPEHVASIAKPFKSPFNMAGELMAMFTKDPNFTKIIPLNELPLILEIGTDGTELRANLYPMEPDYEDNPYDPTWPSKGIYRYRIEANGDSVEVRRILHSASGVRYDPEHVIYSYASTMNAEERTRVRMLFS
jgi:hypothetical protein